MKEGQLATFKMALNKVKGEFSGSLDLAELEENPELQKLSQEFSLPIKTVRNVFIGSPTTIEYDSGKRELVSFDGFYDGNDDDDLGEPLIKGIDTSNITWGTFPQHRKSNNLEKRQKKIIQFPQKK